MAESVADRCNNILNTKINIESVKNNKNESSNQLIYSMEKIKSTGFELESNILEEIDNTLILCRDSFNENS